MAAPGQVVTGAEEVPLLASTAVTEGSPEHEDTRDYRRVSEAHDAAPTNLCDVAKDVVSVSRMRRARDLSSRLNGDDAGEGAPMELPSHVRVVFLATYVRNPEPLFDMEIRIARPWRDPDPKALGRPVTR